jgi:hypothetical protein
MTGLADHDAAIWVITIAGMRIKTAAAGTARISSTKR